MMTEEQARERHCCGSLFIAQATLLASDNAHVEVEGNAFGKCIASQCMAWRWCELEADEAFVAAVRQAAEELGDKTPGRSKAAKHVVDNRAKYGLPTKPFKGFCGLGGKP